VSEDGTWKHLFERAAASEVDREAITETLVAHREGDDA